MEKYLYVIKNVFKNNIPGSLLLVFVIIYAILSLIMCEPNRTDIVLSQQLFVIAVSTVLIMGIVSVIGMIVYGLYYIVKDVLKDIKFYSNKYDMIENVNKTNIKTEKEKL